MLCAHALSSTLYIPLHTYLTFLPDLIQPHTNSHHCIDSIAARTNLSDRNVDDHYSIMRSDRAIFTNPGRSGKFHAWTRGVGEIIPSLCCRPELLVTLVSIILLLMYNPSTLLSALRVLLDSLSFLPAAASQSLQRWLNTITLTGREAARERPRPHRLASVDQSTFVTRWRPRRRFISSSCCLSLISPDDVKG